MESPICDHCNMLLAIVYCLTHLARFCLQCDLTLHSATTVDSPDHSRFIMCNDCVWQPADVQCLEQGLCLCQTCFSNANVTSHNVFNNSLDLDYSFPPHLDALSSSSSSSFIDLSLGYSCVPLPLDSSSSSRVLQYFGNKNSSDQDVQTDYLEIPKDGSFLSFDLYQTKDTNNLWMNSFDDYKSVPNGLDIPQDSSWLCNGYETKDIENTWMNNFDDCKSVLNYLDIPKIVHVYVLMVNIWMNNFDDCKSVSDYMDIPKDSSCSGFNGYETKDLENIWMNNVDDLKAVVDLKEYFSAEDLILTDQLTNEIIKQKTKPDIISFPSPSSSSSSSSSSGMSSVTHRDCSIEALANASCEGYMNNQMICSKEKEETNNNIGLLLPNSFIQLDCRPSRAGLKYKPYEMLPPEDRKPASRAYDPQARLEALKRYFAKKNKRKFGKEIRYESRKSTANTKRRLKGRFTKAGGEYDYDPRTSKSHLQRVY